MRRTLLALVAVALTAGGLSAVQPREAAATGDVAHSQTLVAE